MTPKKRSVRHGAEDRWHRPARRGEQVNWPADQAGGPVWCTDPKHTKAPGTVVCTARHGQGKRWLARWVDHEGNEATKAFHRRADAQRHADSKRTEIDTGTYADPHRSAVTFGTIAEAWIATKAKRAPKTVGGYRGLLDVLILPKWQGEPLHDITHERIQTWITWLSTDPEARQRKTANGNNTGLSPARVIQAHQVMHQVLAYAVRAKYLAVNPATDIELPSKPQSKEIALTHDQVRALADETASAPVRQRSDLRPSLTSLAAMVRFLSYSGLRFGEAAALRVGDVDLAKRRVSISKGVTGVRGQGRIEGETKTHQRRSVPILTTECVEELRQAVAGRDPGEFLFPGPDGGAMTNGWFRVRFDKAVAKLGLDGVTPHTLRHTAGSLAISESPTATGVLLASKLLGHRNLTTTANTYSHMLDGDFDKLAVAMDKAVQAPANG
ncbi:tyrosine-type recombinase/integrase [Mycobacterium intracellulare]|uniref:tyrosine-type recombinase/integrase n=1 Tax=Mycobacterium intracellulare TaxID=1767 RepID=UPI001CDAF8C5|nr:site-specific integrase [Mycobacterium intracellulare]